MEERVTNLHIDIVQKLDFMEANYDALMRVHWNLKDVVVEDKNKPKDQPIKDNQESSSHEFIILDFDTKHDQ